MDRTHSLGRRSLLLGGALALLAAELPALQQQICFSDDVPLQPTNWNSSVTVSKFDPDLGILVGIVFTLNGTAQGSAAVESLDGTPTTVNTAFQAELTLTRPDLTTIVVTTPLATFTDNLTAFDGIIDFGGTSGITHAGIITSDTDIVNSPPPPGDLALFTGPGGAPGTITLPLSARGISNASGSGNLITQFLTSATGELTVCYLYELDCNGNGIPDSEDILLGGMPDGNNDGIPDECQPRTTSICEGDGSANGGLDCPCGNNGNPGEGCDNGSGSGGLLTASGTPSVSNDTLSLTASQIPGNSPGFFFYSTTLSGSGAGQPFGNGLSCLSIGLRVKKVDGGGTIPFGAMPPLSTLLGISPGDTTYFQYLYRNPGGPCLGLGVNATNAIQVVWGL